MKKTNTILLSAVALFSMSGCGGNVESSSEPKTYAKAPQAVYEAACASCHGAKGEGSAKVAPLNKKQSGEVELELYDVINGVTAPEVAEHSMKTLATKGLEYAPKAMADFMEKSFFDLESLKTPAAPAPLLTPVAPPAAEPTPAPAAEPAPAATPAPVTETPAATPTPAVPEPVAAPEVTAQTPAVPEPVKVP